MKPKRLARVKLICSECGRRVAISPRTVRRQGYERFCPKCGEHGTMKLVVEKKV